ncbi:hypothetical protein BDV11DRAFT_195033 [Aspergillus similis]
MRPAFPADYRMTRLCSDKYCDTDRMDSHGLKDWAVCRWTRTEAQSWLTYGQDSRVAATPARQSAAGVLREDTLCRLLASLHLRSSLILFFLSFSSLLFFS